MPKGAYSQVRWTWWKEYSLAEMQEALRGFDVVILNAPQSPWATITRDLKIDLVKVCADSLYAYLSPIRAVLIQKQLGPLTERDNKLKEIIFKLYRHTRARAF